MAPSPAHRGVESNNHRPYRVRQLIQFGGHRAAFSLAHAHAHRLVLLEAQGVLCGRGLEGLRWSAFLERCRWSSVCS